MFIQLQSLFFNQSTYNDTTGVDSAERFNLYRGLYDKHYADYATQSSDNKCYMLHWVCNQKPATPTRRTTFEVYLLDILAMQIG